MATATATAPAKADASAGARRPYRIRQIFAGWAFATPFTVLFLLFMALPVLASLVMSVTDLRSTDLRTPFAVEFVGVDNYTRLLEDAQFRRAALNTALIRFRTLFRVGFYLPVVTSIVALAVVWRFLLDPEAGLVNNALRLVGVDGPNWLGDSQLALPSIIAMAVWRNFGFLMVIFLAGLQAIPAELYESSRLDGAGRWAQFRHITVPLLRPTLLFGGVVTSVGYLQLFEEPLVMTRGGPLDSTLSVSYHIYNQFGFGNYGYAAAVSYVLFAAIVGLSILQFRLLGSRD
jgi:multiple sugar transport system permease protein